AQLELLDQVRKCGAVVERRLDPVRMQAAPRNPNRGRIGHLVAIRIWLPTARGVGQVFEMTYDDDCGRQTIAHDVSPQRICLEARPISLPIRAGGSIDSTTRGRGFTRQFYGWESASTLPKVERY